MGKTKTSLVWAFFTQVEEPTGGHKNSCNLCTYSVEVPSRSKANTSNLMKHVRSVHATALHEEVESRQEEERREKERNRARNPSITDYTLSQSQGQTGSSVSSSSPKVTLTATSSVVGDRTDAFAFAGPSCSKSFICDEQEITSHKDNDLNLK